MSNKYNNSSGTPPKYIADFSKAMAIEVRMLLNEVGKLREERRQLQAEIAELMAVKAKHGGEFAQGWLQKIEPAPEAPPPPEPPMIEDTPPARPGWRTVYKKPEPRRAHKKALPAPAPEPEPPAPQNVPAWAQWRRS
ncbi:hypothetical protein K474DRAFT_1660925 [Panus rudis PR-1116 ss-1]|nr:hypothetical protein K474DRAFT_1660925 [Panus rudis PR-1116 ss-1]